jgi:murein DD-endopeptidase MepM/ murein hydrolase activator NlpD
MTKRFFSQTTLLLLTLLGGPVFFLMVVFQIMPITPTDSVSSVLLLTSSPTVTTAATPSPVPHIESWRLPFNNARRIWNGPGEKLHIGSSSEAIDFLLGDTPPFEEFPVYAVADGVVVDAQNINDFWGIILRINHPSTNSCSLYAHLKPGSVSFTSPFGQSVQQGDFIGTAGQSGDGSNGENHLHFEARSPLCVPGEEGNTHISDNSSIPVRALMGTWWNFWYAPPPGLTVTPTKSSNSGRAEYPPNATPPTEMWQSTPGPRHLSNLDSPTNIPSAYISNINSTEIAGTEVVEAVIHRGAAPDLLSGTSDAYFQTRQYKSQNWYTLMNGGGHIPTYESALADNEQCGINGQFCFAVQSAFQSGGSFTNSRYVDVHPGNPNNFSPSISASYNLNEATVLLTYNFENALEYRVYEYHSGEIFLLGSSPGGCRAVGPGPTG